MSFIKVKADVLGRGPFNMHLYDYSSLVISYTGSMIITPNLLFANLQNFYAKTSFARKLFFSNCQNPWFTRALAGGLHQYSQSPRN